MIPNGGNPNKTQAGDMGIDGRLYPVGTQPKTKDDLFADDWFPIQQVGCHAASCRRRVA